MNDKEFGVNLFLIIMSPILIVAGVVSVLLSRGNNRLTALGYALILFGVFFFLMWLIRVLALRFVNRDKLKEKRIREKQIKSALNVFENSENLPALNTVKLLNAGLEFAADGRFVCGKDYKNISGYHFAFEINSVTSICKNENCDDVCDLESLGVLIEVGYHDGEALEEYANDNGIILKDEAEKLVGQTLQLSPDEGYVFSVTTAESDDADFGFIKILKSENGILTVHFLINVPAGLCDKIEGVVELIKENARTLPSLIGKIRRGWYNTTGIDIEEIEAIKEAHPYLPESYITFLKEVGYTDLDWLNLGWNAKTPTNLDGDEAEDIKISAERAGLNAENFYFFALDSDGNYYAFSKNAGDDKVYAFLSDDTYSNFEDFLYEVLNA